MARLGREVAIGARPGCGAVPIGRDVLLTFSEPIPTGEVRVDAGTTVVIVDYGAGPLGAPHVFVGERLGCFPTPTHRESAIRPSGKDKQAVGASERLEPVALSPICPSAKTPGPAPATRTSIRRVGTRLGLRQPSGARGPRAGGRAAASGRPSMQGLPAPPSSGPSGRTRRGPQARPRQGRRTSAAIGRPGRRPGRS